MEMLGKNKQQNSWNIWIKTQRLIKAVFFFTCFPQESPLLVVGVKGFGEVVRLQQAVQHLQKLLRRQVPIHALVLGLHRDHCCVCISLQEEQHKECVL